jgi:transketolase
MVNDIFEDKLKDLDLKATHARELVMETLLEAGSGHSAGPLGMADIFTAFYFHILNHDPKRPEWEDRDRLVLSNGHICPILYVTLAMAGYFPESELKTLRKIDSRLQGHPHRGALPGIENTSGPLGEGLSQGIGMALAAHLDNKKHHVYVLSSDGEHQEGNVWEAIMFAGNRRLNNITMVIDRNNIQIDGFTEDVMPLEPLKEKWEVIETDGNNIHGFIDSVKHARNVYEKPTCIIARTTPGKGVSFMEWDYTWHGKPPNKEEEKRAIHELRTLGDKIEKE